MAVPDTATDFFQSYVPARFAELKEQLAGKTSAGSLTFRVTGVGEWSLSLADGELVIGDAMADDVLLQVTLAEDDFKELVIESARLQEEQGAKPENQVVALKAITIDEQKAQMVRNVVGTVAFVVTDGDNTRKLCITPGDGEPKVDAPDCSLECGMADFIEMQTGKIQPMQLVMTGKMKIVGNAQLPMALSAVLA